MVNLPTEPQTHAAVLIVFAIFQGSLVLILVYLFIDKVLKFKQKTFDEALVKQEAFAKALSLLEKAKEESLKILNTSHSKARAIVSKSKAFSEHSQKDLDKEIHELSQKHIQSLESTSSGLMAAYKSSIEAEKDKGITEIANTSETLKQGLLTEIDEFKDILHKETIEAEEGVRKEVKREFDEAKVELEDYKKRRLSEIDRNIYEMLAKVSKDIMGKAITIDEHEDIVRRLLEEAGKEGKFVL